LAASFVHSEGSKLAKISWVIVTFGDSGSLQHDCGERVEGDTLENPDQSIEKQGFLS
jgi:hypothetical protein